MQQHQHSAAAAAEG